MAAYSTEYSDIITKNRPDKDIEIFWYNYKNHILNIYRNSFRDSTDDLIIQNEIVVLSMMLNVHQEKEEWSSIIVKIRNFQIFAIFFILESFKKDKIRYGIFTNTFILYVKFLKRWNQIKMVGELNKIPLKDWNRVDKDIIASNPEYLNDIIKSGITIVMIGKNIHIRKYDGFINLLMQYYNFKNYWFDKNNYMVVAVSVLPMIELFFTRCVSVFLFDIVSGKIDATTLPLDYISHIIDFKDKWYKANKDKVPSYYNNGLCTKKFCTKLEKLLKIEDFQ